MPRQQSLPTWLALNDANFPTASGIQDLRTGQDFPNGGLGLGDFFEMTEKEANNASARINGLLHSGQYRLIQVDSGATVANVKTGTVGYLRGGSFVQSVVITAPGTGGTPGTYNVPANPSSGGGSGAVLTVVVNASGALASASVLQQGFNYNTVPSFSLALAALTGGSGTVAAQLNTSPNVVTSYDQAVTQATQVRPVVFLNSITPGNYGFIQELGVATVLCGAAAGSAAAGDYVNVGANGLVTTTAKTGSPVGSTIGVAIDAVNASALFKCYLGYAAMPVQD